MQKRLTVALAAVAIFALTLYAGPRTFMIISLVQDQERASTDRVADLMVDTIDERMAEADGDLEAAFEDLVREGERLTLVLDDGTRVQVGAVGSQGIAHRAQRTLPSGGTLTLDLGSELVDRKVSEALTPVVVMGTLVAMASVALAWMLARMLVQPFRRLVDYASRISDDDPGPAPRAGMAEADDLADALTRSADRVAELLQREREFSANASHQLRTPLAALRLRLDGLLLHQGLDEDTEEELRASLHETDRLADTITDLLELARDGGIGTRTGSDLGPSIEGCVARWRERFTELDRQISLGPVPSDAVGAISTRALCQVADVLLENALVHGVGRVSVELEEDADHVSLRVSDEGTVDEDVADRVFERSVRSPTSAGSGIGLDLAQSIAEAAGCRLSLVDRRPTTFELAIPHA